MRSKDMIIKSLAFSASAAALGFVAGLAFGGVASAQEADPLACAVTAEGVGIRMGTEVLDSEGERIGAVSLSQCSTEAQTGKLRVLLDTRLGGEVRAFPLEGATATPSAVRLPVTAEEVASLAPANKTSPGA